MVTNRIAKYYEPQQQEAQKAESYAFSYAMIFIAAFSGMLVFRLMTRK